MKIGIVILHCSEKVANLNLCIKFLTDFTLQCVCMRFLRLYFTAREFPPILPFTITSLSSKYLSVFTDNCSNNLYILHINI